MQESRFSITTTYIEDCPNNLCEAIILGMPCIATHSCGTGSLLADYHEGVLIQDGCKWVMAGAILEFITPPKVRIYGKTSRLKALKRHDKETIISNLIETYSNIIGKE